MNWNQSEIVKVAIKTKDQAVVKMLIDNGAKVDSLDENSRENLSTLLHLQMDNGEIDSTAEIRETAGE